VKYLLLICGDESAAAHADEGCGGWTEDIIECADLDEAIQAAARHPAAGYGSIEVRELM
jgi:hypothetical protein